MKKMMAGWDNGGRAVGVGGLAGGTSFTLTVRYHDGRHGEGRNRPV